MSQQRIETILGELNYSVEKLEDDTTAFNFAVTVANRPVHFLAQKDDLAAVWAVCGLRLSDEHWASLLKLSEQDRKRFYIRVKELLLVRGVRYSLNKEREDDTSPRMLQVSSRIDVDNMNRSSVHSAINEVIDGGAIFANVAEGIAT